MKPIVIRGTLRTSVHYKGDEAIFDVSLTLPLPEVVNTRYLRVTVTAPRTCFDKIPVIQPDSSRLTVIGTPYGWPSDKLMLMSAIFVSPCRTLIASDLEEIHARRPLPA
jgi:hypothetical protein